MCQNPDRVEKVFAKVTQGFTGFSVKALSIRVLTFVAVVAVFPRMTSACPNARSCHLVKKESVANAAMPCHSTKNINAPVKIADAKNCKCCLQIEGERNIRQGFEFRPDFLVIQAAASPAISIHRNLSQSVSQKPKIFFARNRIFLDKAVLLL